MKRYAVNPAVSLREELDGALLYNPDTDDVLLINDTGRLIWEAMAQPRTSEEIAAYLEANTEGAVNVCADVEAFIESLLPDFAIVYDEPIAPSE
jgi:sensor domain CHASE-containing protein